MTQNM